MTTKDVFKNEQCDFCGQYYDNAATSPIGVYCKNCWKLIIDMAETAIEQLEEEEKFFQKTIDK